MSERQTIRSFTFEEFQNNVYMCLMRRCSVFGSSHVHWSSPLDQQVCEINVPNSFNFIYPLQQHKSFGFIIFHVLIQIYPVLNHSHPNKPEFMQETNHSRSNFIYRAKGCTSTHRVTDFNLSKIDEKDTFGWPNQL